MVAEGVENVTSLVCVVCIKGENTARLGRDTLHAVKRRPVHPILLSLPTGAAFIQKNLRTTLTREGIGTRGRGPQRHRVGRWGVGEREGGAVRHTLFFLSKTSRPVDTQMRAPLCHKNTNTKRCTNPSQPRGRLRSTGSHRESGPSATLLTGAHIHPHQFRPCFYVPPSLRLKGGAGRGRRGRGPRRPDTCMVARLPTRSVQCAHGTIMSPP